MAKFVITLDAKGLADLAVGMAMGEQLLKNNGMGERASEIADSLARITESLEVVL